MNTNPDRSYHFIKKIKFAALLVSLLIIIPACVLISPGAVPSVPPPGKQVPSQPAEQPYQPATQPPQHVAQPSQPVVQPPQPVAQPSQPAGQNGTSIGEVVGGWYGPACDEAEGTYIYRWSVDLMNNPQTGQLVGAVKFHDCPGGGRVLYRVGGNPPAGKVFTLAGEKRDGGGDLFESAAESITFTFDSSTGQITPNLAP
jgi:hypothetical protein